MISAGPGGFVAPNLISKRWRSHFTGFSGYISAVHHQSLQPPVIRSKKLNDNPGSTSQGCGGGRKPRQWSKSEDFPLWVDRCFEVGYFKELVCSAFNLGGATTTALSCYQWNNFAQHADIKAAGTSLEAGHTVWSPQQGATGHFKWTTMNLTATVEGDACMLHSSRSILPFKQVYTEQLRGKTLPSIAGQEIHVVVSCISNEVKPRLTTVERLTVEPV